MSNPASDRPHHTPQQHGRHHDYEGATEPRGPGEGQPPPAASGAPRRNEGVENPREPESQPDGFGEPDEPEHSNDEDPSPAARPNPRGSTRRPAPSDPLR